MHIRYLNDMMHPNRGLRCALADAPRITRSPSLLTNNSKMIAPEDTEQVSRG